MTPKETRNCPAAQVRAVNDEQLTIDVVASTFDIDGHGTRIDQSGWDLRDFLANPVILLSHDYGNSFLGASFTGGLPVARGENVRVVNGQLVATLRFPSKDTDEFANRVYRLMRDGFINAVSVGFEPTEWEDVTEKGAGGDEMTVRTFRKQRLLEISVVCVPSNSKALAIRAKELNKGEQEVEAARTELRQIEGVILERSRVEEAKTKIAEYAPQHVLKCVRYFEQKQPANRAATKALARFYKSRGLEVPEDEPEAWERMAEMIEEEKQPEPKADKEAKDEPRQDDTPAPEPKPEEKAAPEPSTPAPAEAPPAARKASVHVPLPVALTFNRSVARVFAEAVVEAQRQGYPQGKMPRLLDSLADRLKESIPLPHP